MAGYLTKPRIARWWRLTDTSLFVEGAMHIAQAFLRKDTGVTSKQQSMYVQLNATDPVWDQVRAQMQQQLVYLSGCWRGQASQVRA